jgi:hypothetical protein
VGESEALEYVFDVMISGGTLQMPVDDGGRLAASLLARGTHRKGGNDEARPGR